MEERQVALQYMLETNELSDCSFSGKTSIYTPEKIAAHNEFFRQLTNEFGLAKVDTDVIAVLHILPDSVPFTKAIRRIADINTIIPKPKSININSLNALRTLPVKHLTRENIFGIINAIKKRTVFLDIGGYFSCITDSLLQTVGENFCGIVEDTENGLQKYQARNIDFPFISVARSPLKENEDVMVGQAIAYSAEALLRQHGILFNGLQVGVIGYGKIGKSVAYNVEQKQGRVSIYDKNHVRLTHALSAGFNISNKSDIIAKSDVLCLATGNTSLSGEDYAQIKNGGWLFSVTSSDDELDKEWLEQNYCQERMSQYVKKYSRGNHYFYLLNDGNAINFIHGTTVGDFILLVHAELLIAAYRLMTNRVVPGEYEIDDRTRNEISKLWLSFFK